MLSNVAYWKLVHFTFWVPHGGVCYIFSILVLFVVPGKSYLVGPLQHVRIRPISIGLLVWRVSVATSSRPQWSWSFAVAQRNDVLFHSRRK